jgi:hypothetical protein
LFYFLQTHYQTAFEKYITTDALLKAVLFFAAVTISFVAFTYLYLGLRKRSFFFKERIKKSLELWISHVILSEGEEEEMHIPEKFIKMFRHPTARQYAIENLITNKKSFSGAVADNIRDLYEKLGFKNDSVKKMQSRKWFVQAKGIQELAIMDQNDQIIKVYRLTNSKNELVRNEAQNAITQWSGFKGLRFLDVVRYEISEWQQIQLLVLLKNFTQQEMPKLRNWLSSQNDTVVVFALRLAETYQQFGVKDKVEDCLFHRNEKVRVQAVNTLSKIGDNKSADKMTVQYSNESQQNQINILNRLPLIAGEEHLSFLAGQLNAEDDFIKLSAARAIAEMHHLEVLEEKATEQPEPYQHILKHVKAELAF